MPQTKPTRSTHTQVGWIAPSEFQLNSLTWPESKVTATLAKGRLSATLNAENGRVDIRKLKETIAGMSMPIGKKNYAESLPDMMQYKKLAAALPCKMSRLR